MNVIPSTVGYRLVWIVVSNILELNNQINHFVPYSFKTTNICVCEHGRRWAPRDLMSPFVVAVALFI
jgi:hypothetical protein